jgi:N-acyl-D-aspartate/D-glutamate deacylase
MTIVAERLLPAYRSALDQALVDAAAQLPEGPWRKTLLQLRRRTGAEGARDRLAALERLAQLAESRGWLGAGEAIVLRKLAYRVAVLEEHTGRENHLATKPTAAGDS